MNINIIYINLIINLININVKTSNNIIFKKKKKSFLFLPDLFPSVVTAVQS